MSAPNPFGAGKGATKAPAAKKAAPAPAKKASPAPAATAVADPEETAADEPTTLASAPRDPFAQPSGASDYKFTDWVNELLLVRPYEEDVIKTKISDTTEVIRCDAIRLDNENEVCEDVLVFQSALLRTFRKVLKGPNNWTIGRLEMGEAKNGRSAPYIFTRATEEEIQHGVAVAKELNLQL